VKRLTLVLLGVWDMTGGEAARKAKAFAAACSANAKKIGWLAFGYAVLSATALLNGWAIEKSYLDPNPSLAIQFLALGFGGQSLASPGLAPASNVNAKTPELATLRCAAPGSEAAKANGQGARCFVQKNYWVPGSQWPNYGEMKAGMLYIWGKEALREAQNAAEDAGSDPAKISVTPGLMADDGFLVAPFSTQTEGERARAMRSGSWGWKRPAGPEWAAVPQSAIDQAMNEDPWSPGRRAWLLFNGQSGLFLLGWINAFVMYSVGLIVFMVGRAAVKTLPQAARSAVWRAPLVARALGRGTWIALGLLFGLLGQHRRAIGMAGLGVAATGVILTALAWVGGGVEERWASSVSPSAGLSWAAGHPFAALQGPDESEIPLLYVLGCPVDAPSAACEWSEGGEFWGSPDESERRDRIRESDLAGMLGRSADYLKNRGGAKTPLMYSHDNVAYAAWIIAPSSDGRNVNARVRSGPDAIGWPSDPFWHGKAVQAAAREAFAAHPWSEKNRVSHRFEAGAWWVARCLLMLAAAVAALGVAGFVAFMAALSAWGSAKKATATLEQKGRQAGGGRLASLLEAKEIAEAIEKAGAPQGAKEQAPRAARRL
jgi:hypothetical protein